MTLKKNIIAFFAIGILGTVGHFLYEWTGENYLIGLIFPVNESTWEHLKLLFFPTVIYSIIEYFIIRHKPKNYISSVIYSVICGMLSIVLLFYTINGILGYNVDFINIAIYYISIIIMLLKKRKIITKEKFSIDAAKWIFTAIGILLTILFAVWSYNPPNLGIFIPPSG